MKKSLILLIVSFMYIHAVATAEGGNAATNRPPNVLYILCCKLSTAAVGAYGEKDVHTPNIDYLAETGMRFNNCYTPQSLCGPSRASILTGSYPHGHGLKKNVYPTKPGGLYTNYQEAIPDPFRDTRFKLWYILTRVKFWD